jgi:hypothetical protein
MLTIFCMPYSFLNLSFLDNEEENDDYSNNQESLVLKLGGMAMTSQHVSPIRRGFAPSFVN